MAAPSIDIVDCAAHHFAYLPRHATIYTVSAVAAATPVWTTARDRNLPRTGWLIGCFPDAPGDAIFTGPAPEVQIGPEIEGPFEEDALLRHGETPAGRAAFSSFHGEHEQVEVLHRAIRDWCTEQSEVLAGPIWERYVWNTDPAHRLIEVYYLLA